MTRKWLIYMYTFPNGKRYVGATCRTLAQRQGVGFKKYKLCKTLWSAIEQYGVENIQQTILCSDVLDDDEAAYLERAFIAHYDTTNPERGYNKLRGGEGISSRDLSEERKSELREQVKGLHKRNLNRTVSQETRAKQRAAKLGKKRGPMSEETKAKISKANSRENMSEETRLRRIASKQKPIVAVEKTTGEKLVFPCGADAAKHFGVRESSVSRWISGQRKPHVNYTFQFLTTNND